MKKLGLIMLAVSLAVGFAFLSCDQTFTTDTAALAYAQAKAEAIDAAKQEPVSPFAPYTLNFTGSATAGTDQWSNGFYIRIDLVGLRNTLKAGTTLAISGTITPAGGNNGTDDNFQIQYVCPDPWTNFGQTGNFATAFTASTAIPVNYVITTDADGINKDPSKNKLNIQTAKGGGADGGAGTGFVLAYNLTVLITPAPPEE